MNLGQLVRSKMKELNADNAGEYVDNRGNHFKMSAEGEGYAISYGGGKSINVTREQGARLASNCRKLEGERKELAGDQANRDFLKKELEQYGLSASDKKHIYDMMADGVEIMSKAQITKTIEEHIDLM